MNDTWMESSTHNVSGGKHIAIGSSLESEELSRLEHEVENVEVRFEDYAEKNLSFEKPVNDQRAEISKMTKLYCLGMAGLCLTPLRKGVNSKSVLRVIGLWVGCCFFSKSFRQETNRVISDVMYPLMSKKSEKPNSFVSRRKALVMKNSDNFLPTPDSLAVVKIAFCRQAYARMHEKHADVDAVMGQYRRAIKELDNYAMSNGIRVDAVNKSMRKIASDLMDKDPTFVIVFEETAYDTMLRGEDTVHRQNYKDGDEVKTRTWSAWEGNYVDVSGNPFDGEFTPRRPSTVNDIRRRSKNTWYNLMNKVNTPEDWGDIVASDYARGIQRRYTYMVCEDLHLTPGSVMDLNSLMDTNDDVTWMIDIDGNDPFGVGSYGVPFSTFIAKGPDKDSDQILLGNYPEFKSAYSKWLNNHTDVSPFYMQKCANDAYYEYAARGKKDNNIVGQISDCLAERDRLQSRWDDVFAAVNEKIHAVAADSDKRLKENRRALRPLPGDVRPEREMSM